MATINIPSYWVSSFAVVRPQSTNGSDTTERKLSMSNSEMEQGLDKEGQEILAEFEKDGYEITGREKPVEVTPEIKPEVKPPEPKPEVQPEIKPEVKPEIKPEPKTTPDRKVQHVPLPKYLETERQLKEANDKIAELSKTGVKPSEQIIDQASDAVKKLVDEFGYEEAEAQKLTDVIKSLIPGQALTAEQQTALAEINTLKTEATRHLESIKEREDALAFTQDFTNTVIKDFPHLADYQDQIKQMAYTEQYAKTPLRAVALAFMDAEGITQKPVDVITAEKGGGGTGGQGETIDFANITEEQFSKLSPDQQEKFFAFQDVKERQARGALN